MTQDKRLAEGKLFELFDIVEEHLQSEVAAILILASKDGAGAHLCFATNCCDAIVKKALGELLRRYDEKTPIPEESAH